MVFALFGNLLEGMFQGALQKLNHHGWRKMEHFAASSHLAVVTVIRELSIYKGFTVIDTANIFTDRILHILGEERLEPKLTGLVRQIATKSHGLVAREKRRIALGANAQVQVLELDGSHL